MNGSKEKRFQPQPPREARDGSLERTSMHGAARPLSPTQERILRLGESEASPRLYARARVRMRGALKRTALRTALDRIVARHEVLRTGFMADGEELIQRVAPADTGFALEEVTLPPDQSDDTEHPQPFDLARAPLIRGRLAQLGADEYVLTIIQHPIVADTWSVGVLLRELARLYNAYSAGEADPLPPLARQFAEHASAEQERGSGERLRWRREYWARALAGMPQRLSLPARRIGAAAAPAVERVPIGLPGELYAELQALAHRKELPLFVPLLCGWAVLLGRWAGQQDVVVGTRMANRSSPELERLIGPFESLVALRVRFDDEMTVEQLLKDIKAVVRKGRSHQEVSFDEVLQEAGVQPDGSAAIQVLMSVNANPLEAAGFHEIDLSGMTITDVAVEAVNAPFELSLSMDETPQGLGGVLEYDSNLFERQTIERLRAGWEVVLTEMVTDIYRPVGRLPVMTGAERHRVVCEFNETAAPYPKHRLIHELFEEQVRRTPDAIAVEHEGRRLTYAQLNRRSNQVARYLVSEGVGPDEVIGICIERGLEMVVALLAILKAGGAYLPLDPNYPAARLAQMLKDAAPRLVLTETELAGVLPACQARVIALDEKLRQIAAFVDENLSAGELGVTPRNLVYVIYTSGSTGEPKGTAMVHRSMVNLIEWHRRTLAGEHARVLQFAALSFDVAFQEVFSTLCTGGALVLLDEWVRRDPKALTEFIRRHSIERVFLPPLMLQSVAEHVAAAGEISAPLVPPPGLDIMAAYCRAADVLPHGLRDVITAGEPLRISAEIRDLFRSLGRCRLHNHYGPTETHVVTALTLEGDPGSWPALPPIGRPIANARILVLDERMQPAPIGVAGEIHIGGANLARGYLHRPDLTRQRFIPDPCGAGARARLYKTGDVGRWRPDGTLEYLGRNDEQVKIRGYRVELGEIEAQLSRCAQVRDAAVLAREDPSGAKRLVAYVTPRSRVPPAIDDLRSHLKSVLPQYMVPSAFVVLDAMPLTPSGKLDRRSLPVPGSEADARSEWEAPQGETERTLALIWQELLEIEQVGRNDNFLELGGHSYLIVKMMDRLRRAGLSADVRHFFQSRTLAELAGVLIRDAPAAAIPPNRIPIGCETITPEMLPLIELGSDAIDRIVRSVPGGAGNVEDIYPLAPLQEGILFHHLLDERRAQTYVLPALLSVPSRDRLEDLIAALQAAIDRHDVLRSAVLWEGLPRPVQVVYRQARLPVTQTRLEPGRVALEQMRERMDPRQQSLEIGRAPMMRLQVVSGETAGPLYALLQLHHLACDHESLEALLSEVMRRVEGVEGDLPAPEPYRNHVAQALMHGRGADTEAFFRARLGGIDEPTAPFGLVDVRGDGSRTAEACGSISPELAVAVRAVSRRCAVTPAALFHAAWALVVSATSARDDVVFGTVLLGRLQGSAGAGRVLGMFMNTLPLRLSLEGLTAGELIALCQRELVELVTHEQASLASVQRCSGMTGSAPLFTTLLNFRHGASQPGRVRAAGDGRCHEEPVRVLEIREWTNYPISVSIDDLGEGFGLVAQTDRGIAPARVIGYLLTALEGLVRALEQDGRAAALDVSILPDRERRQVITGFNTTEREYPDRKLVHELIEERAEWLPAATAVLCDGRALTYEDLNRRANQLAWCLRAKGLGPDQLVGIWMQRSVDMIVALLGVLKAGGAYLPLDVSQPVDRIAQMLADASPRFVLTHADAGRGLPDTGAEAIAIDEDWIEIARHRTSNPARSPELHSGRLAYAIYTSGSTGLPKGVLIEHRSLVNLIEWHCEAFRVGQGTRCSSVAAAGFDAMVWEVWPPLSAGATLVLPPLEAARDVQGLVSWWAQERLDVSFLPTPLAEFAFGRDIVNPGIRSLLVGGDRLRRRPQTPAISVINNYGPTETTVVATSGPVLPADEVLHIGRPIANTKVYILDRRGRPVAVGVAGEVYIGGVGVARGYLNRPQLTAERFLADPFSTEEGARMYRTGDLARWREDGTIEFLGRNDNQVKIRGFRIELGEIEEHLSSHPRVLEVAVQAREDAPGEPRLVAYVIARSDAADGEPSPEALREHLRSRLPEYMVPSAFVLLDQLPLTPNGKLDRRALPAPQAEAFTSGRYEAPQGETEERLARIWQEVLGCGRIGRGDNFFDLGGNSLTATQVTARLRAETAVRIPVGALFDSPMLMDLAARVDRCRSEAQETQSEGIDRGSRELFEMVSSMSESEAQRVLREMMKGERA